MKKAVLLILCLSMGRIYAQEPVEKEVRTDVGDVTVYLEGAQETRKTTIDIPQGKTMLKFVNLSPFIDAKSVQVKADGDVTIFTVNHQQNFIAKTGKSAELTDLETKLKDVQAKIKVENTYLEVIKEDLEFLKENRALGGKDQSLSVTALKEGSDFYSTRLTALKMKEIERNNTLEVYLKQESDINNQILSLTTKKEYATGEIMVLVEAKSPVKASFEITYLVSNAGWYPSYDIRANNINEPIEVVYKANIRQDTKYDWKNVRLKLSSYNPSVSGVAPELKTYFLDYGMVPPVYGKSINSVSGRICDSKGEPLPGAIIKVEDSGIGTVANTQGYYTLTLPANASQLTFTYLGYLSKTLNITGSVLNAYLDEDIAKLSEVVKLEAVDLKGQDALNGADVAAVEGKVAGLAFAKNMRIRGTSGIVPQQQVEKQISVDFEIKTPYTVNTDNKVVSVDIQALQLPADFQYFSVPKINKEAFLIAQITDWEKYSFLEGEANVFFEDTYVGKTILDANSATDTLKISLGRDKKVSVQREKVKDYTSKQFIGSKKEDVRDWKITIRNNRSEKINMMLLDQVPVSTNAEIEVSVQQLSGAKQNPENGEIKWDFKLDPGQEKIVDLRYSVKYPKNQYLVIE
jgi:hypothetical protein